MLQSDKTKRKNSGHFQGVFLLLFLRLQNQEWGRHYFGTNMWSLAFRRAKYGGVVFDVKGQI